MLVAHGIPEGTADSARDRKSTRLNSSHPSISYAVFCLKKKKIPSLPLLLAIPAIQKVSPNLFDRDTATTEIYTLSLHDALPIFRPRGEHAMVVCGRGPYLANAAFWH